MAKKDAATATAEPTAAPVLDEVVVEATDIVHIPAGSHAVANLADVGALVEDDAGQVDHGFTKQDIAIPWMRILQSNSPQVAEKQPSYVDGAEVGAFFNTATNTTYGDVVEVIPIAFQVQWTLWWPRQTGGPKGEKGFAGEVTKAQAEALLKVTTKNDKGKDVTPDGKELIQSAMYYCIVLREKGPQPIFDLVAFPLTSTQLKKARMWNALISQAKLPNASGVGTFNPKMFGYVYVLEAVPESNAKGNWIGVKVIQGPPLLTTKAGQWVEGFEGGAVLYGAARDLEKLVRSGARKADMSKMDGGDDGGTMSGAGAGVDDEKLPF
jgi:hypothetical protein